MGASVKTVMSQPLKGISSQYEEEVSAYCMVNRTQAAQPKRWPSGMKIGKTFNLCFKGFGGLTASMQTYGLSRRSEKL